MHEQMKKVRSALAGARRVAVLTGAGISAESGVPTFRGGPDSLWAGHRPEALATPEAFRRDPALVWRWYLWRRGLIDAVAPNEGHRALAALEARTPQFTLVTQNVDGLHQLAGSAAPIELHGGIWAVRCTRCGETRRDRALSYPQLPPPCPACGEALRPDIVWFGESLDPLRLSGAVRAAETAQVFLVVGTSGLVQPAASLAGIARDAGALVVEVNLERTPLSGVVEVSLCGRAGEILPGLLTA